MKIRQLMLGALLGVAMAAPGAAQAEWPERPITMIVPWSAGGGTDAVGRMIAQGLQEELGMPVNVVNRTGAGGIVGHTAMAQAEPDGYTIGLATAEITTYAAMGTSDLTYEQVTPLALVNFDASAFNVAADSPWETVGDAIEALKADPSAYKMSGMPVGAAFHLAFAGFLNEAGIDPAEVVMVPSQGAAPGFQELVSGGVDIVPSSLPEAGPLRDAGRVKTLAVLADERLDAFPDVPTVEEATGLKVVGGTWRGVVAPLGLEPELAAKLTAALRTVYDSAQFQEFMAQRGFGVKWLDGEAFRAFMAEADATNRVVIEKLGLAG